MAEQFSYFLPLTKVVEQDDGTCLVYTRGVQEEPDISNEIFDYASSVPLLEKWSRATYERSQGKSYGNVRAMHGKQASGKIVEPLRYNPTEKAVDLVIKVVDPIDVKKCREGVYTGMSIGGRYARRWPDPKFPGSIRYTAEPIEFSLVDIPNVRSATFDLVKQGGDVEIKKFAEDVGGSTPVNESMKEVAGSEHFAPDANNVPRPEIGVGEYIVKEGVDSPLKAPDSLSHGVEAQKIEQIAVPDWAKPVVQAVEKLVGARQTSEELLKAAGLQVGIARREHEPFEPPVGYPVDAAEYGDPANWGWRYDTGEFAKAAVVQYNLRKNRDRYDDREWNILGRRLAGRATALLDAKYSYDPVNKRIVKPETPMAALQKGALEDVMNHLRRAAQQGLNNADKPQVVMDVLNQIIAGIDVATDAPPAPEPKPADVASTLAMAAEPTPKEELPPPASTPKTAAPSKTVEKEATPSKMKKEAAEEPPPPAEEEETEMEKRISTVESTMEKILKAVEALSKQQPEAVRPLPLRKNSPFGDLSVLPSGDETRERTALEKTILAAAAEVREGVTAGRVRSVMTEAGGDPEEAKTVALNLVRESLAARGFTSASKIRTISPAIAAQLRQKS